MLKLRPFEPEDTGVILSWLDSERAFRMWSADRYKVYPATSDDMLDLYKSISKSSPMYPMTAIDDGKSVGHMIMRYVDEGVIRFGFIIVDNSIRGKGYGRRMLELAIDYVSKNLSAAKITLGVFENNPSAFNCYKSVGFKENGSDYFDIMNEKWKCIEMELDIKNPNNH